MQQSQSRHWTISRKAVLAAHRSDKTENQKSTPYAVASSLLTIILSHIGDKIYYGLASAALRLALRDAIIIACMCPRI
eukprot:scaffold20185_cov38-Cyclotella_meneghiniana.AAC.2